MPRPISKIYWLDKSGLRDYEPADRGRLFKWVLFERGGELCLAAMSDDAGLDFHMELLAEVAKRLGWCDAPGAADFLARYDSGFREAGVTALGGGLRLRDGSVRNLSTRFGPVPAEYEKEALKLLGLRSG